MNFQVHCGEAMRIISLNKRSSRQKLFKWIVVAKLITLLIVLSLQVSATAYSQQISITYKNAPLRDVLEAIQRQSPGYGFIIESGNLGLSKPVTVNLKSASIEETLQTIFAAQPFTYVIKKKFIIIKARDKEKKITEAAIDAGELKQKDISGLVTDEKGQPLIGATVLLKGTNQGTSTDQNGRFTLANAPESGSLLIRMLGHESLTVPYQNGTVKTIALREVNADLDAVQVIAYGEVTKKFNTSNIGMITADDIAKQPISNPLLALQGRVPGIYIQQQSGVNGRALNTRVQGLNSINSGLSPFYVIDGVPYSGEFTGGSLMGAADSNPGTFNFINPSDIESISVLKDADATAIYGSRAANGAILITTKKGKSGKTRVDVNARNGWGQIAHKLDLMNTQQYLAMRKEGYLNSKQPVPSSATAPTSSNYDLTVWDQNRYTDWQKVLVGETAQFTDIQASVSGGSDNTQFLVGYNYNRQTSVFPGDLADVKGNLHFNLNHSSRDSKFKYMLSGIYVQNKNRLNNTDLMSVATTLSPNAPAVYQADGSLNFEPLPNNPNVFSFRNNPMVSLLQQFRGNTSNVIANNTLSYEILPGLSLKSSMGYTKLQSDETLITPITVYAPSVPLPSRQRTGNFLTKSLSTWIIEPQMTYFKETKVGRFDALIGGTFQQTDNNGLSQIGRGYTNDAQLRNLGAAASVSVNNVYETLYKYSAIFGRFNYRLDDKYILNFTARRDGTSRFGSESKFHNFYAIGGAWLFSDENVVKSMLPWLSQGKLRVSYGTTGNDQIPDYAYLSTLKSFDDVTIPYQGALSIHPTNIANPYLQWEETRKLNLGLDLGLLRDRIQVALNWYRNRSSNQLVNTGLPYITGFGLVQENFPATVQNRGIEAVLDFKPIKSKNFNWYASLNFTSNKNKLISYQGLSESTGFSQFVIGQPVNIIHAYKFAGVNSTTGLYEFINSKGEKTSTPDANKDRTVLIDINPKWFAGFSNSFQYKGFQLDVLFQYVNQKAQGRRFGSYPGASLSNQPTSVLDNWKKPGDVKQIEKYASNLLDIRTPFAAANTSDANYNNASFLRLKNLSFSYTVPNSLLKPIKITNARIYFQGQNLWTKTKFVGTDPETTSLINLPPLRVYTLGLQVGI
jgi:TonB-linked SusC/RagA family outer membrane protein